MSSKTSSILENKKTESVNDSESTPNLQSDDKPKETIQEVLMRLEKAVYTKNKLVEELKEKIYQAQEDRFKALQDFANVKEQYLLSVVSNLQNKQANECKDSR